MISTEYINKIKHELGLIVLVLLNIFSLIFVLYSLYFIVLNRFYTYNPEYKDLYVQMDSIPMLIPKFFWGYNIEFSFVLFLLNIYANYILLRNMKMVSWLKTLIKVLPYLAFALTFYWCLLSLE